MPERKRHELAIKARRQSALARPELRKPRDALVIVSPSRGVTGPPVREFAPELRQKIDAALARAKAKRGGG